MRHNPRMSNPRIMVNGAMVAPGAPALVPLDDGLVRGDGVFEGLRVYGRRPRTLEAHLDRMERSALRIQLDFPRDLIRGEIGRFCAEASAAECGLRVMLTRGGARVLREEPLLPEAPEGWTVLPVPHRITPLLVASKTLSYAANMQAARIAAGEGADTALMIDPDSDGVLECPVASFVWLEGDDLVAPPLATGILDSITRRLIAEVTTLHVRERSAAELASAEGALLSPVFMDEHPQDGCAESEPQQVVSHGNQSLAVGEFDNNLNGTGACPSSKPLGHLSL